MLTERTEAPVRVPATLPAVTGTGPKILFSQPVTLHFDLPLPEGSRFVGREADDVRAFGLRYGAGIGELLLGGAYALRLCRRSRSVDVRGDRTVRADVCGFTRHAAGPPQAARFARSGMVAPAPPLVAKAGQRLGSQAYRPRCMENTGFLRIGSRGLRQLLRH